MKKEEINHPKLDSLSDVHRIFGLPKPLHSLVSLIGGAMNQLNEGSFPHVHILNFTRFRTGQGSGAK